MKKMYIFYAFFVFGILTSKKVDAKLSILGKVKDVISFGVDVYSLFDFILGDGESESTPAPIDIERTIKRISERIEISMESIVFKIELQAYISELRSIALIVKQLLEKMEEIVKTENKDSREELQKRFRTHFQTHEIEMQKLKSLLTFKVDVSGISSTLLSLIANEFECGMTSSEEFQNYYMTLVSDAVALALLNERLSENSLYNETIASWDTAIRSLFDDMEAQKDECKDQFSELITKDLMQINDPTILFESIQKKYPYKVTDVLYLGGSYCLWSLKDYEKLLDKNTDNPMTYIFINDEENAQSLTTEQLQKIVSTTKYENCLEDTNKVMSYFDLLDQDLVFWLMFPVDNADDFKILLDKNSSSKSITISKYTTIVYLRVQTQGVNGTLTAEDFDVELYSAPVPAEAPFTLLGLVTWKLGVIGGSILLCFIVAGIYCFFLRCRRCRRNH